MNVVGLTNDTKTSYVELPRKKKILHVRVVGGRLEVTTPKEVLYYDMEKQKWCQAGGVKDSPDFMVSMRAYLDLLLV